MVRNTKVILKIFSKSLLEKRNSFKFISKCFERLCDCHYFQIILIELRTMQQMNSISLTPFLCESIDGQVRGPWRGEGEGGLV